MYGKQVDFANTKTTRTASGQINYQPIGKPIDLRTNGFEVKEGTTVKFK